MPYYDYRKKPPRKESIGPEEGYRSHARRQGDAPRSDKPANSARTDNAGADGGRRDQGSSSGKSHGDAHKPGNAPYRAKSGPGPQRDAVRTTPNTRPGNAPYRAKGGPAPQQDAVRTTPNTRPGDAPYRAKGGPAPQRDAVRTAPSPRPGNSYQPRPSAPPPRPVQDAVRTAPSPRPSNSYQPRPSTPPARPVQDYEENLPPENMLVGRNPIREALRSGRDFEKLLVARGDLTGSAREIVSMARERHILVQEVDRSRLDALSSHHQGLIAFASAYKYATVEDMFALAQERGEPAFLVLLDGITDPHNLGAIIRSAECAGAHGVILPERRAVGLTPAAVKASAGAIEHLPVARIGNLVRLIDMLKERGVWVSAACMEGEPYDKADLSGPVALVVGGEGDGVARLVAEHCDRRVALPLRGKIESLNASVAAGILMYEVARQRQP